MIPKSFVTLLEAEIQEVSDPFASLSLEMQEDTEPRPVDEESLGFGSRARRVLRDRVGRPLLAVFILAWGLRLF